MSEITPVTNAPVPENFAEIAERIRNRIRRTTLDMIDTGNDLILVKERLKHGEFLAWIEAEFGMTDRTARNYIQMAKWTKGKSETVSILPPSTLYRLGAPSTSEELRSEVISDIQSGRPIDCPTLEARIKMDRMVRALERREKSRRQDGQSPRARSQREAENRRVRDEIETRDCVATVAASQILEIIHLKLADPDRDRVLELLLIPDAARKVVERAKARAVEVSRNHTRVVGRRDRRRFMSSDTFHHIGDAAADVVPQLTTKRMTAARRLFLDPDECCLLDQRAIDFVLKAGVAAIDFASPPRSIASYSIRTVDTRPILSLSLPALKPSEGP